ncbi:hypothetical protein DSO57_1004235 [Entomophthora muscae]|uniref:Uncharacterized protein n=1 Tax=Entomophthora muscae TaxID=34485 RepID=A0ACC2SAQ2_9FUNG|nr:hypothetical protein DSO57_1004235 [Entomophthora muscae]
MGLSIMYEWFVVGSCKGALHQWQRDGVQIASLGQCFMTSSKRILDEGSVIKQDLCFWVLFMNGGYLGVHVPSVKFIISICRAEERLTWMSIICTKSILEVNERFAYSNL